MQNKWTDIFALSQFGIGSTKIPYGERTARIIINNYLTGDGIRITLANRFGAHTVPIDKASVAPCDKEGALKGPATAITFAGKEGALIGGYSSIQSDEVDCEIKEGYLAINLLFGKGARLNSANMLREKVILSPKGDYTDVRQFADANRFADKLISMGFKLMKSERCDIIPALECVSVRSAEKCVIAFGDSITQGGLWSYRLAQRLSRPVLNLSIGGNRLIYDCTNLPLLHGIFGKSALSRFEKDVLERNNAAALIIELGTNDIGAPGSPAAPKRESVSASQIIEGFKTIIAKAKQKGLAVFICTLPPFKGYRMGYLEGSEQKRQEVNAWIRACEGFDGCFDFDNSIKDEKNPEIISLPYDSGDHLHPSDSGSRKMADDMALEALKAVITNGK
ncbi:MAG: GDSL-type esterase/lipase family protein [Christensenellales bacterium]|jgi:lysophospholipase L1-like esterase